VSQNFIWDERGAGKIASGGSHLSASKAPEKEKTGDIDTPVSKPTLVGVGDAAGGAARWEGKSSEKSFG